MSASRATEGDGRPRRPSGGGGLVGLFVRHPTAGNLLMLVMLLAGVAGLSQMNRQFFPEFGIDVVVVTVPWPGAAAEDVEGTVVQAVEPELRFLDGVKRVLGVAAEGVATLYVEFEPGSDMQKALSDVESAVAQVTTLPEDAERPRVHRLVRYDTIRRLVLSGPYGEAALKAFALEIRDGLLARGADRVTLSGVRDEEIRVEVAPEALRRLDLTLDELAGAIGRSSQDVPAGETRGATERQPRALGLARTAPEVAAIEVRAAPGGHKLTVGDAAHVEEGFDRDDGEGRRGGRRAVELHVERAPGADALELAATVDAYVAELRRTLPANLAIEAHDDAAQLIEDRINLLVRNGATGLVLVVGVLFLFLNARIALWVAAGIPTAMLAMLGLLWLAGMTINMISLFAMILAIGIVVDDAIVVGEHAAVLHESGLTPLDAAERAALDMAAPVVSASLTTIAAFLPLFMVGGLIGQVIRDIPLVVIIVLLASLVECFLVLPSHLRGALAAGAAARTSRTRRALNDAFERFRRGPFRRLAALAVEWRYATLAAAAGALILSIGVILGGRVGFVFYTGPEGSTVFANLVMAPGTGRVETERALAAVDAALARADAGLTGGGEGDGIVVMSFGRLGESVGARPGEPSLSGDNVGSLHVELVSSDRRDVRTGELIDAWRGEIPDIPGLESLTLVEQFAGPPGRELDIRLRGGADVAALKQAALEVRALLERLPGVGQIDDDLPYGKPEVLVELTPRGRALGFTTEDVGRQLRDAFEGRIAKRFPRGEEEVEVRVLLTEAAQGGADLASLMLRSPASGREVPLGEVATLRPDRGFARIQRQDGVRRVAVTAELDEAVIQLGPVIEALEAGGLPEIAARHGLEYRFAGKAEEQAETLADIRFGAVIALALIYIILAWVFGSFTRPFAVMAIIPFGVVGAVFGHLAMGYDLSILSLIALLGLSGILVNDSIILVTAIDQRIRGGLPVAAAVVEGACARLRAVLLTSATTIGGLLPLMFETSFQARFMIPMAITICFGLLATTLLVLLVVPALVAIQADLGALRPRRREREPAAA